MRHRTHASIALAAVLLAVACWGLSARGAHGGFPAARRTVDRAAVDARRTKPIDTAPAKRQPRRRQKRNAEPPPPEPPTIPKVSMTKELTETCLVRVGDTMPDAELRDLEGKPHSLALRGTGSSRSSASGEAARRWRAC